MLEVCYDVTTGAGRANQGGAGWAETDPNPEPKLDLLSACFFARSVATNSVARELTNKKKPGAKGMLCT